MSIKINGLEEAYKMMDGLPLQMKAAALNSAHRKAMNEHIIKPARDARPDFKKAWRVSNSREDKLAVIGGARSGRNDNGVPFGVLLWEEYGTTERTRKSGASTGVFPKSPFFRSIVARGIKPMIRFLNDGYGDLIIKYLERQKKTLTRRASKL